MVKQSSDNGEYTSNPLYYQHCNLSNINVMIDGISILDQDCDVGNKMINVYYESFVAHGDTTFAPLEAYTKGAFIICVKTVEHNQDELSIERRGNLSIKLRLSENLISSHIVYIVGTIDATFEINSDREVFTNYTY